ncbi:MAG: glycosyltransferase [Clostridiales bacterium]|nr:glycosyltransferase [Clostridiales bacterium]
MIKVLNVISDTNIGGAGKCVITYCSNYNKEKYEIVVVMPKDSLLKPEIEKTGVKIIEIDGLKDKSFDIKAIKILKKIIKEEKPDIVHTHSSLSAKIAAKSFKNIKIVYTKHCVFPPSSKYKYKIFKLAYKFVTESLSHKIIATAQKAKEDLIYQGVSENKIEVILNGTTSLNILDENKKKEIRKRYNLTEEDKVIGLLARVEEYKGHKYFIDAAKIIIDEWGSNYKFLIMGTGNYEQQAKKQVKELGIEDNVIFTGFISNVEEMLNILDVQVNASYVSETTCLSLLEGMSIGLPAVATNCGGTPFVIISNENGMLVETESGKAIADGIKNVLSDKEKYEYMKKTSIKIFNEKFTSKIYAENIEKVYESMVN